MIHKLNIIFGLFNGTGIAPDYKALDNRIVFFSREVFESVLPMLSFILADPGSYSIVLIIIIKAVGDSDVIEVGSLMGTVIKVAYLNSRAKAFDNHN